MSWFKGERRQMSEVKLPSKKSADIQSTAIKDGPSLHGPNKLLGTDEDDHDIEQGEEKTQG